jgi:hypothetical protein
MSVVEADLKGHLRECAANQKTILYRLNRLEKVILGAAAALVAASPVLKLLGF